MGEKRTGGGKDPGREKTWWEKKDLVGRKDPTIEEKTR